MEFSADTKSLAEALDRVQEAVEKKSTVPILSHALVEASSNGLRLAATDLELGIRTFCPAQAKAPGSAAAPARRLLEIIRSLPEGEVRVRAQENQWVQVSAGRSLFKLAAPAKDNFPALPVLLSRGVHPHHADHLRPVPELRSRSAHVQYHHGDNRRGSIAGVTAAGCAARLRADTCRLFGL